MWAPAGAEAGAVTNRFGFAGKEIFPIDYQINHLRVGDLDGDGLQDLVVVNNLRSKINLLFNKTGKPLEMGEGRKAGAEGARGNVNELRPDSRFRIESLASEKRISSFVLGDLNGDARLDIAYYGEPKELVLHYNDGKGGWGSPKRFGIEDGLLNPNALVSGDLNGDGRLDLVLLAEHHAYFFPQDANHILMEPETIPYSGALQAIQILDIDGNGRDDLLLVNWDNANPFRFRLQNLQGVLGAEMYFPMAPIRSYWADDLDGDKKTEVITISRKSGRAQIANFSLGKPEKLVGDWSQGQFHVLPLERTAKAKRGLRWADINGDGLTDLLAAEPEGGQLSLFLQNAGGGLGAAKVFPTLTAVSEIEVGDWDEDGRPEIFVLSMEEGQIGIAQWSPTGRLDFPRLARIEGRPLAMEAGVMAAGEGLKLIAVVDVEGKREAQVYDSEGGVVRKPLSESFRSNPSDLFLHDVNQDGLIDLLIVIPYEKLKVLLRMAGGGFEEVDLALPAGTGDQPWLSTADVDGDGKAELLIPQKNFLRAVVMESEAERAGEKGRRAWSFRVKEQINGAGTDARLTGATGILREGNAVVSLFLLDGEKKQLTLTERNQEGVWQVIRNISLPVSAFQSLSSIVLDQADKKGVGLAGTEAAAWMGFEGDRWEFVELDGYETPIKEAFLHDVVSGDLNQDGRKDLVFLETSKSYLDVVTFESPHHLRAANRWQVFEERTFRSRRADSFEPREALVADLTGDGKNDLVVVVHDRIILYPQE